MVKESSWMLVWWGNNYRMWVLWRNQIE